jgi:uncharacterized protein YkwD
MRLIFVTSLVTLVMQQTALVVAAAPQDTAGSIARVLELTNAERQKAGLGPLTVSAQLTDAAQNYSQVMATSDCFEHTCGPVPNFADRDGQAGYTGWTAIGENIAGGYPTPDAVVAGWMASPEHRSNILSPNFTEIGVGVVTGDGKFGTYWTQEFGARRSAADTAQAPVTADSATPDESGT